MKTIVGALVACAAVSAAHAERGDFRIVVDERRAVADEDSAVHGFAMLRENAVNAKGVGAVGRAFSVSRRENNALWGVVTEAINFPGASGHVLGMEAAAVNMTHDNDGVIRGIDVVFKNRLDVGYFEPVPEVGENRFNEKSAAVQVSAQPRSPAGEYSGWQTGLKFARHSLDRSAGVPYAAAIDVSEAEVPARLYLIVWRCGAVKCGLEATADGAAVVVDIEGREIR